MTFSGLFPCYFSEVELSDQIWCRVNIM